MSIAEVLSVIAATVGLSVIAYAALKWIFGPRAALEITKLLQPLQDQMTELRTENTEQHAQNAARLDTLAATQTERWKAHSDLHSALSATLARIEEG